jgi:hypothetical protein
MASTAQRATGTSPLRRLRSHTRSSQAGGTPALPYARSPEACRGRPPCAVRKWLPRPCRAAMIVPRMMRRRTHSPSFPSRPSVNGLVMDGPFDVWPSRPIPLRPLRPPVQWIECLIPFAFMADLAPLGTRLNISSGLGSLSCLSCFSWLILPSRPWAIGLGIDLASHEAG